MEILFVYLWLKLNTLIVVCAVVGVFCGLFFLASSISNADAFRPLAWAEWWSRKRKFCFLSISFLVLAVSIPDRGDTAILIGTHYAVKLANSPEGEKVVSLIRQKANEYLDEQLKQKSK